MTPDKFFTAESLATVSGCAGFVWIVVNGLRRFFGFTMPWLFLAVSAVVNGTAFYGANGRLPTAVEALILLGNVFVVGLAALGLQEAAVNGPGRVGGATANARQRVGWFTSWLS